MTEVDRELARKNMIMGWLLFGAFVVLFGAVIVAAFVYLALD
jgi:hypothetical protein